MVIRYLDRQYEIIANVKSTSDLKLYSARESGGTEQKPCTIACISNAALAKKLVPVTTKKNTCLTFTDLRTSFNADGRYYIVFDHAVGQTLQQSLADHSYNLKERLLIFRNICSRIFVQNMPDCFVYEILRKDNIVINDALDVRFNYFFTEVDYYSQATEKDCLYRISGLARELFQKEITEKSARELAGFVSDLEHGRYAYIWDCYDAFNTVYDRLMLHDRQTLQPGRIWWRAWEAFKKKLPVIRTVLTTLLILAAGIFLLLNLPDPVLSEEGISFSRIGTLQILEQADTAADGSSPETGQN